MGRIAWGAAVAAGAIAMWTAAPAAAQDPFVYGATPDGSSIVFESPDRLAPDDQDSAADIYVWKGGENRLVSTGPAAAAGSPWPSEGMSYISNDGRTVVFQSWDRLTSDDHDWSSDVYERTGGHTALLPTGPTHPGGGDNDHRESPRGTAAG